MPITVEWLDESKQIVLYRIVGVWTLEEAMNALEQSHQLSEPPPKLYLTDLREAKGLPFGILSRQEYISKYMNTTTGLTVMLGAHPLVRFFMNALVRLGMPLKNLVFVETMEEAMKLFASHEPKQEL